MIRIGTQGWNYDDWVGPFYPAGTRPGDFLAVYGRAFDTVEVDSTFYGTPPEKTVRAWAQRTPRRFRFALKLPQEITHERRLRDALSLTAEFCDRARALDDKLGPVLVQLGADFTLRERSALTRFVSGLPRDIRFAIEFRRGEWIRDDVLGMLREHSVAFALTDARYISRARMLEMAERPTTDFVYVRWMGRDRSLTDHSRVQIDRRREMETWATLLRGLAAQGTAVYGYVSNLFAGHAPASARDLQELLGLEPVDPGAIGEQLSLL